MNETLAHQSTVLYKRLCVNIINKHKIYFRSQYNNNISINLNNYNDNVQDRPTHLDPGTRPLSLATVILCVSTGNVCGPSWTHPLIMHLRPEVDMRMRWNAWRGTGPHLGIQGFPRIRRPPKWEAWRHLRRRLGHSVQNRIRT